MSKILAAILLITVFVAIASASSTCGSTADEIKRNLALKWVSAFKSINSTLTYYNPPQPQYPPDQIGGNIAYDPAIIGITKVVLGGQNYNFPTFGLFGNVTVLYGVPGQYQGVTSYTGAMDIQPDILPNGLPSCVTGLVNHHLQLSNLASASYQPGSTATRQYTWHDTPDGIDNVLQLTVPGVADLYWRRNVPLPISSFAFPSDCTASATLTLSSQWVSNGTPVAQYTVSITNTGTKTITGLNVQINIGSDTVNSQYNIDVASGTVSNFYQLAPGASNTQAGFQLAGSSAPVITGVTATCAAN